MGTVYQGTTGTFQRITAPFEPAENRVGTGAIESWPTTSGNSSYARIYLSPNFRYRSSTPSNLNFGLGTGVHNFWSYASSTITLENQPTYDYFYYYKEKPSTGGNPSFLKKMNLVGTDIDLNDFTATIVRWDDSLDTRLKERWLVSSDFTSATYYAIETPTVNYTGDWEVSTDTDSYAAGDPHIFPLFGPSYDL